MSTVPESSELPDERLAERLRGAVETIEATVALLDRPGTGVQGPLPARAVRELGRSLVELARLAERPGTPRALRIAVVNTVTDGAVAILDLVPSPSDLPRTTRGRERPPSSGEAPPL